MDDEQVMRTESEVRVRLQRDLRSIPVGSYAQYRARAEKRLRPRSLRTATVLAGGVTLVVVALIVGSTLAELRRNAAASPTPLPTEAVPSASVTPSVAPSPTAQPTPLPSGRPAGGIEAYPLGALHGEYAFVLNGGADTLPGAVAELWAVPLAGGQPRLAARFANSTTPATSTGDNRLARQLSPDGRQLMIAAATPRASAGERVGLFVVDLESGHVRSLGVDDAADQEKPAWSPDGRRIAYVNRPIVGAGTTRSANDDGIWVMNADGRGARKVPLPPAPAGAHLFTRTELIGWTPDGRIAWYYQSLENELTLTDVDRGTHTTVRAGVGDVFRGVSFRTAAPRIAGSFSDRPQNCPGHYVAVLDGAPERVLVRAPDRPQCPLRIQSVRWNPAREELLYLLERETAINELYITDLSGTSRRVAVNADAVVAEWDPAGTRVLYIHRTAAVQMAHLPFIGGELRSIGRDGTNERTLFAPRAPAALSDIAVKLYR